MLILCQLQLTDPFCCFKYPPENFYFRILKLAYFVAMMEKNGFQLRLLDFGGLESYIQYRREVFDEKEKTLQIQPQAHSPRLTDTQAIGRTDARR